MFVTLAGKLYGTNETKGNIDIRIAVKDGSNSFIFSTRLPASTTLAGIYKAYELKFSSSGKLDLFLHDVLVSTDGKSLSALTNEELNAVKSGNGFEFRPNETTKTGDTNLQ
jgi:hypothetical protein